MLTKDIRSLLPIGSVVQLSGAEKKLMIFGVRQTNQETGKEFDYVGVMYPEGNMGEDTRFLFDNSDIEKVVFLGYSDPEREDFLKNLSDFYAQ